MFEITHISFFKDGYYYVVDIDRQDTETHIELETATELKSKSLLVSNGGVDFWGYKIK